MSVAYVVLGVRMSALFECKVVEREVTRFDEETGQPYEKIIQQQSLLFLGKQIDTPGTIFPGGWNAPGMPLEGLDIVHNGLEEMPQQEGERRYNFEDFVVGIRLAGTFKNTDPLIEIPLEKYHNAVVEVENTLGLLGYNGIVNLFLIHVS